MATSRKLSKFSVSLDINLRQLLGEKVPQDSEFKEAVAQRALDIIQSRTEEGRSWKGHKFKKYSDEYRKSDDFKAFGKSAGEVNLTLTGDMLGTMDVIAETRDKITLGWDDETENAKAANHVGGVTVPKRDFFNLNKKELKQLAQFAKELADVER